MQDSGAAPVGVKDEPSESCNSDDLNSILENMDIDKDFNMWNSFRSSVAARKSGSLSSLEDDATTTDRGTFRSDSNVLESVTETIPSDGDACSGEIECVLEGDDRQWAKRLARTEVFSHRYRPTAQEFKELEDIEILLNMQRKSKRSLFFVGSNNSVEGDMDAAAWSALFHPTSAQPSSILLKRGPCLLDSKNGEECELLLLTQGMVIATICSNNATASSASSLLLKRNKSFIRRKLSKVILWSDVDHVSCSLQLPPSVPSQATHNTVWNLVVQNAETATTAADSTWSFACATPRQRDAWLQAMEQVIIQYHMHHKRQPTSSVLGWQYQYIWKPGFTFSVTGRPDGLSQLLKHHPSSSSSILNQVDDYNGYAPIHYAVRSDNDTAVRILLDAGVDANQEDKEGRTPMYYAQRDGVSESIRLLLESFGAERSQRADEESAGALFGQVSAVAQKVEKQRAEERRLEEGKKAEAAQHQMNQNLRLLQIRGEKIEELGSKASDVHDGAQDFGSMAKQLKENSKKKKWYRL